MDKTSYDFLDVLRGTIEDKVSTLDQTIYCKIVGINEDYTLDVTVVPDEITRIRSVVNASKYEFKVGDYGILYKIGNNLANAFIIAKLGPSYEDNQPLNKQVSGGGDEDGSGETVINNYYQTINSIVAGDGLTSSGSDTVTISLGTPSASGSGSNTYGSNNVTADSHTHQIDLPDATESAKGVIELATDDEAAAGTDTTRAINAKQLAAATQSVIDSAKVTIQTSNGITGGSATAGNSFTLSGVNASTMAKGVVQLAADNDTTSTDKAVTPKQLETARKNAQVSITAGNGLTGGGTGNNLSVAMGTPSTVNQTTTNSTTATSHTHELKFNTVNSPAVNGNEISFIDTVSQGANGGISATKKTVRSASTTQTGVVQLATQNEVNTGTNTTKVITPATLGKGKASGVASLDANGKIILSQIPDAVYGNVLYGGNLTEFTDEDLAASVSISSSLRARLGLADTVTTITVANATASSITGEYGYASLEGVYFICEVAGSWGLTGSFEVGDWMISTGTSWQKVDNTDAVKSVNGQIGDVNITKVDSATNADMARDATSARYADEAQAVSNQFSFGAFPIDTSTDNAFNGAEATALRFASPLQVTKSGNTTTVTLPSVIQKYTTTITGDGKTTDFTVQHGLGTGDVQVSVYLTGQTIGRRAANELVMVDTYVENRVTHQIHLVFATAPATSQTFKVVVIG